MSQKRSVWLKLCAICGILAPIVAFACIFTAIAFYPPFSWTENALSDLGVQNGITAILFNSGLIIGGFSALIFALGLFQFLGEQALGKIGVITFIWDAIALVAIGVFPENVKPTHLYVSVVFFALFPIAMFFVTATFLLMHRVKMGLFTFLVAAFSIAVWAIQWTIHFGSGVAIPEALSAFAASAWSIMLAYKMLKQASHSNN